MPPYRVALIGYGIGGAVFHAPLVSAVSGLELAAIVTRSPEKIEQARRDFPRAKILTSAEEIFASASEYDLVIVTSPNRYHFPQAKAALEAGLHVVIDKPMANTAVHCQELIELARSRGRFLSVFQNRRWDGDFLTIKKIIDEDMLGPIVRFESRFERYRPLPRPGAWRELGGAEDGGGLLLDLGSHLIDQACFLFGTPKEIYCELDRRRAEVETDDDCFVALAFPGGVRAHLWASVMCRIKGHRFRLLGQRGSFEKYGLDPQEDALRAGQRPGDPAWGKDQEANWGNLLTDFGGRTVDGKLETGKGCYETFYQKIYEALEKANPDLLPVDAAEALRTAQILEAAGKSAREKTVICF